MEPTDLWGIELKDLWRIVVRRRRVVYWTFVIVALVSAALVAYGAYQSLNLTEMSLVVTEQALTPAQLTRQVPNLNSIPWDPPKEMMSLSVDVVNSAFSFTDRRQFFDTMSALLKKNYGINKTWQAVQSTLDVYPAAQNHIYFKASGSPADDLTNQRLLTTAAGLVEDYINNTYPKLYPMGLPPHVAVWDPVNLQKAVHLTKSTTDFVTRCLTGLALGVVLAFLWEYLDNYTHDERDVEILLGTRALSVIPTQAPGARLTA